LQFIVLALGIAILLFLIIRVKLNTFVALITTAVLVALGLGMNPYNIADTITKGIGNSMGELAIVFGFGAMIGRLVSEAGGSYRISQTLIGFFGKKRLQLAIVVASFIIGMSMFFEVGLVLLTPIVFSIALEAGVPFLYLGLPMVAALSTTQAFLPPQPAPTAVATALSANIGQVLLYGIIVAIPTVIVAGPLFTKLAQRYAPEAFGYKKELPAFGEIKQFNLEDTPKFGISILTSLFPVIFMGAATIYQLVVTGANASAAKHGFNAYMSMIGSPVVAMLVSLLFAIWSMGIHQKRSMKQIGDALTESIKSIAMLLMIISGGSAFKQVLLDGGVGDAIQHLVAGVNLSPLILAWLIAVVLRIALGSAAVASMTAAGLVTPLMIATHADPAMLVLAIGAGSVAASHVNDAGFWMFQEYFDLTVKQTLAIWTVLETVLSVVGLICVLILNAIVN
jgi:GntP family gluconate:H+ symporter